MSNEKSEHVQELTPVEATAGTELESKQDTDYWLRELAKQQTHDHFLVLLVDLTNRGLLSVNITVTISGFLVSGTLSSGKEYFRFVNETLVDTVKNDDARKFYGSQIEQISKYYEEEELLAEPDDAPRFLHLKDAQAFHTSGSAVPSDSGIWWRCRMSQVAAFTLGRLSSGPVPKS